MHRPTTASGAAFGGPVAVSLCLHLALAGALLDLVGATTTPVPAPAVIAVPFTVVPYVAVRAARASAAEPAKAVPAAVAPVQAPVAAATPARAAAAPVPQAPVPQAPIARAPRAPIPSPARPIPVPAAAAPGSAQAAPPRPETVALRRDVPDAAAPSPEAVTATELKERRKTPPPPTGGQATSASPATRIADAAVPGLANGRATDIPRPVAAAAGNPVPAYPRQARLKGWEGTVVLAVTVGPDGRCRSLAVARSSGFALLDRAALEAVRQWRFEPARRNGLAVEAVAEVPVTFRLT